MIGSLLRPYVVSTFQPGHYNPTRLRRKYKTLEIVSLNDRLPHEKTRLMNSSQLKLYVFVADTLFNFAEELSFD